ncbi:MAG TPA: putative Ig domain-containing protein, partial [Candidatus Competibacteraceae bacterium]|nr:putative Ig domain-containing protein [Candidatus Competibacteraceae bacterium]
IASSGQILGSQDIPIQFTSDNLAAPVTVTIRSPGAGKLEGLFSCAFTPAEGTGACNGTLRLTDDEGSPMSGVLIGLGDVSPDQIGKFSLTFDPAEGELGKTNDQGQIQVSINLQRPGAYSFPFQTQPGGTATFTFNVTVPAPNSLVITLDPLTAEVGKPYTGILKAEGGVPPFEWTVVGALPPGLSLNAATGTIGGTPTTKGTFSFVVNVKEVRPDGDTSGALTGSAAFTITVGEDQATLTVSLAPTTGTVGLPFNGLVSATGGSAPYTFSILAGRLPNGVSLSSSGTLSGTPTAVGTFAVSIQATDSKGVTGTGNFEITIASESPLTITLEGGGAGTVGQPFGSVLAATGGAPPYTFRLVAGSAPGLTLNSNGTFSGTPTTAGTFALTVEATDSSGLKGTGTVTVTIAEQGGGTGEPLAVTLNTPPAATAGTPYSTVLGTATGGTAPYTWTIESRGNLPTDITLSSTGVLSGTFGAAGTFNFVVRVTDSSNPVQTSIANATITVNPGSGGGGVTPSQLTLLTSSPDLPSSGQNPVTLTAIARDAGGVLLQDVTVNFQVRSGDGTLQIVRGTTDETGTAQALLSTGGNQRNRTLTIGASAGSVTATDVTVNVTGTTLEVSGATSGAIPLSTAADPNPVALTFALKDSAGTGIAGATLVMTGAPGGSRSLVTNSSGLAEVDLQFTVAGNYSINAFWDNNSANAATTTLPLDLIVSNDSFTITVTDSVLVNGTLVNDVVGIAPGFGNVTVEWRQNGAFVPGATITLSTNKGTLGTTSGANPLVTTISSTVPGPATISANGTSPDPAISPVTNQRTIQFNATAPDTLTLQVNPSSIPVNVPPATSSQSTIVATVRDAVQNPVGNIDVAFEIIQDVSGGSLSSGTAKTNFSGQASVVYTAGTSPTPENGVIIRATVTGTAISQTVNLTVSRREVFITLGTGNTITEPNATTYALPYNVLVNDIVGGAVSGATVTLDTVPTQYRKGQHFWNGVSWVPVVAVSCSNEDTNGNGILDPGEDTNGNGRLDPGNVVTPSVASVVTDLDGFGDFDVLYAQQYAYWINTELTARTKVGGSEDIEVANFVLPGLASDYTSLTQAPPGQPSPFGVLSKCDLSVEDEASLTLSINPADDLSLPVGGTQLSPLASVSDTITVIADLVPSADLTGASVVANANSANALIAITVPAVQTVSVNNAVFTVTVANTSTLSSVPVAVGGTQVGTITFALGDAKLVVPVILTQ